MNDEGPRWWPVAGEADLAAGEVMVVGVEGRSFALGLMRNVEADQRWGIGSVADRGTDFANKNGWLSVTNANGSDEDDDGRWVANSVGIVTVGGQQVLMAVLTEHNPDFATGVHLVQAITKQAINAVATPTASSGRPTAHKDTPKH